MKSKLPIVLFTLILLGGLAIQNQASYAESETFPEEYYYEPVTYVKGVTATPESSKLWQNKKVTRTECMIDGNLLVSIYNDDTHVTWYLVNHKYFEEVEQATPVNDTPQIKEEMLGTERIGNITAQKKLFIHTYNNGGVCKTISWIDPATNFPIKNEISMSGVSQVTVCEYRNAKIGPQNPELFTLPAGYVRVASYEQLFVGNDKQSNPLKSALDSAVQQLINDAINNKLH